MVTVGKKATVACLDCEVAIELSYRPIEGQIITCPHCGAELEVISTNPLEIDFYFEDWDDDDDLDDDFDEAEDWDEDENWE